MKRQRPQYNRGFHNQKGYQYKKRQENSLWDNNWKKCSNCCEAGSDTEEEMTYDENGWPKRYQN